MTSLQELCLNTIENNGTSVREVLKDVHCRIPWNEDESDSEDCDFVCDIEYDGSYHVKLYPELLKERSKIVCFLNLWN